MGKISEKIFQEEDLRERVTIRVLPEKMQIYPRFKELVTKQLGSDVCFVTTSLWEAFLTAMAENPPADQPIEMKFLRQNVQINIGCSIKYQPKKARRYPSKEWTGSDPSFPYYINRDKNPILPGIIEQWDSLKPEAQKFWRERLQEAGIIQDPGSPIDPNITPESKSPPFVSTPAQPKPLKKFCELCWNSMTNVTAWIKRKIWSE